MAAGAVVTTPGAGVPRADYDAVVIGAGLLGCCVALRLIERAPAARVLLAERGGLPDEGGATVVAPCLLPPDPPARSRRARAWLAARLPPEAWWPEPWLELGAPEDGASAHAPEPPPWLRAWFDRAAVAAVGVGPSALQGAAAATALARRAVAAGVDLALNADVRADGPDDLVLAHRTVDRSMRVVVGARSRIRAGAVVVAAGADGAAVVERGLGAPVHAERAFRQFPRLRLPSPVPLRWGRPRLPVVRYGGYAARPVPGGLVLVPPAPPPDPAGYVPCGGRFLGVAVGVRRELLEGLLEAPGLEPLLASGDLDLGKRVGSVPGAWSALPGRSAVSRSRGDGWWWVRGGRDDVADDVAEALACADEAAGG